MQVASKIGFARRMSYSLTSFYLPLRARAEAPRIMLSVGNIPYVAKDVPFPEWTALKKTGKISHFGQLPSLLTSSGQLISQSGAVCRYIAKLTKLYPEDAEKAAEADMVFELAQEMAIINPVANYYQRDSAEWKAKHDGYFARLLLFFSCFHTFYKLSYIFAFCADLRQI